MTLSKEKTSIVHINEGFDFLGQNIRKYGDTLLIKPSKSNIKSVKKKIHTIVHNNKTSKTCNLIRQLNPIIRGWANYHRHVVASEAYSEVKDYNFKLLWQWAVRRHPKKNKHWIKRKYFNYKWVFNAIDNGVETKLHPVHREIKRHIIIKRGANPYDPVWETYFESREDRMMISHLKGYRMLTRIWRSQKGICPMCRGKITKETKWNTHHIKPKHLGGQYTFSNLVMLHPDCHRQLHSLKITVTKPCYESNNSIKEA